MLKCNEGELIQESICVTKCSSEYVNDHGICRKNCDNPKKIVFSYTPEDRLQENKKLTSKKLIKLRKLNKLMK